MSRERIVIIGAGMAGATTAYFLTRRGAPDVTLLEREKVPGSQSTGRNAAILRTMIPHPLLNQLACQSAEFYLDPPEGFSSEPLVNTVGIYLAARPEHAPTLKKWCDDNPGCGMQQAPAGRMYEQIPVLARGLECIAHKPTDGVLDVHAILQGFLRGAMSAGAEVQLGREFKSVQVRNGRVVGVETDDGFLEASKVVIANGAWASLARCFNGCSLPFTPFRRHLLVTEPLAEVKPDWPVVWIVGDEFYFRPESGGLLMSGCDAVKVTPDQGEIADQGELERIASKAACWLPSLEDARVARAWAGMRTFVPDDLFVIGPDTRVSGLFWVAGLGGHGITCAPVVGRLAADWIREGKSEHPAAGALVPGRLTQ